MMKQERRKPDRVTAMKNIIIDVRTEFPFDEPDANICGISCVGCPKKLLELVDTELCEWESKLEYGEIPDFGEIAKLGKLCKNVKRGLKRNGLVN